jgi:hypothetical protein
MALFINNGFEHHIYMFSGEASRDKIPRRCCPVRRVSASMEVMWKQVVAALDTAFLTTLLKWSVSSRTPWTDRASQAQWKIWIRTTGNFSLSCERLFCQLGNLLNVFGHQIPESTNVDLLVVKTKSYGRILDILKSAPRFSEKYDQTKGLPNATTCREGLSFQSPSVILNTQPWKQVYW